jgi:hypothetical protein
MVATARRGGVPCRADRLTVDNEVTYLLWARHQHVVCTSPGHHVQLPPSRYLTPPCNGLRGSHSAQMPAGTWPRCPGVGRPGRRGAVPSSDEYRGWTSGCQTRGGIGDKPLRNAPPLPRPFGDAVSTCGSPQRAAREPRPRAKSSHALYRAAATALATRGRRRCIVDAAGPCEMRPLTTSSVSRLCGHLPFCLRRPQRPRRRHPAARPSRPSALPVLSSGGGHSRPANCRPVCTGKRGRPPLRSPAMRGRCAPHWRRGRRGPRSPPTAVDGLHEAAPLAVELAPRLVVGRCKPCWNGWDDLLRAVEAGAAIACEVGLTTGTRIERPGSANRPGSWRRAWRHAGSGD